MTRILLVPDVKGWAWWYMAQGLRKWANVECSVVTQEQFGAFTQECTHVLSTFDAILQYSWTEFSHDKRIRRNCALLASHGADYYYPPEGDTVPEKIATKLRNRRKALRAFKRFDRLLCVSPRLRESAAQLGANAVTTLPGVDHMVFRPAKRKPRKHIVVGWCGQEHAETKGYHEVLEPLIRLNHPNIHWELNCRTAKNPLTQEEMRDWYAGIDVLLCTSCSEGSPMPPYEAMACGRPVISTDVGTMRQLITSDTGWIVPSWTTRDNARQTINAISEILSSPLNLETKGRLSRERICDEFSWEKRAGDWIEGILP